MPAGPRKKGSRGTPRARIKEEILYRIWPSLIPKVIGQCPK